jgi:uncharacterized protein
MLDRGTQLQGTWVTGGNAAAHWLRIAVGPYSGDFVSGVNLSANQRPNVVRAINSEMTVLQRADMLAFPAAVDSVLVSVEPGTSVHAAAEVDGGWIEVQRKLGGVGYLPARAFESQQQETAIAAPAPKSNRFQPSFDCSRATKWAEIQVCNTAILAEQDRHIADDYIVLMRAASGLERANLRSAQRSWIVSRDQCESHGGLTCLDQVYGARLAALNAQIRSSSGPPVQSSVRPLETIPPTTISTFQCVKNDNPNVHATFIVDYINHTVRSPNFGAIGQNLAAQVSDSTISWHAREVRNYGFGGFIDQEMRIDKATGALIDNYGDGITYFSCHSE